MPKIILLIEVLVVSLVLAVVLFVSRPIDTAVSQIMPANEVTEMQGAANNTVNLERPSFLDEQ